MTDTHDPGRCDRTPGLLTERDDGRLDRAGREALDEHLTRCAACAEVARAWEEARDALALLRPGRAADEEVARVLAAVDAAAGAPADTGSGAGSYTGPDTGSGAPILSLDDERAAYRRALHAAAAVRGPSRGRRVAAGLLVALLGAAAGVLLWVQLWGGEADLRSEEAVVAEGGGAGAGAGAGADAGAGAVADAGSAAEAEAAGAETGAEIGPAPADAVPFVVDVETGPLVDFARELWVDARVLLLAALEERSASPPREPAGGEPAPTPIDVLPTDPGALVATDGDGEIEREVGVAVASADPPQALPEETPTLPDERPLRAPTVAAVEPSAESLRQRPPQRPRERPRPGFAGGPVMRGEVMLLREDGGLTLAFSATRSGDVRDYRDEVPALLTLLEHDEADVVSLARARLEVLRAEAERIPEVTAAVEEGLALEAERNRPRAWFVPSIDRRETPAEQRTLQQAWALWWALAEPHLPSTPDQGAD